MATTVEITLADDQTLTVGIAEQPSADLDDSQQVANIDQALAMAKHLLTNPPADTDNEAGEDDSAAGGAGAPTAQASGSPGGADGSGGAGGVATTGSGGAGGNDAQAMWQQLAAQQGPAH